VTRRTLTVSLLAALVVGAGGFGDDLQGFLQPIRDDEIRETVQYLAGLGSRVAGYEGADEAARYIQAKFGDIGLSNVYVQEFRVTVPVTNRATLLIRPRTKGAFPAREFEILPLWPNRVRTCQTPPEGITGRLIDAQDGELYSFNGIPADEIAGSIAMVDFDSETRWFNAPLLGARVVLFPEPEHATTRGEAESKFLSPPADMPRFWVEKADARVIRDLLRSNEMEATVVADVRWELRPGYNIIGEVPGTNPDYANERIVLDAYYDSMSVVPDLAPGAESASSIASLLQLAKCFAQNPPERTLTFLASSAHFEALTGTREYLRDWMERSWAAPYASRIPAADSQITHVCYTSYDPQRHIAQVARFASMGSTIYPTVYVKIGSGAKVKDGPSTVEIRSTDEQRPFSATVDLASAEGWEMRDRDGSWAAAPMAPAEVDNTRSGDLSLFRYVIPWTPDPPLPPGEEGKEEKRRALGRLEIEHKVQFAEAAAPAAEEKPPVIKAFVSVDLSSQSDLLCVFYKGQFYNMAEGQQWKYSDYGKSCSEYARNTLAALGRSTEDKVFADAINSITGQNWRSYMPGRLAMDCEQAAVAALPAVGFATGNDMRILVDTPFDVAERVNYDNIALQTRVLAGVLRQTFQPATEDGPKDMGGLDFARRPRPVTLDADVWAVIDGLVCEFDPIVDYFPNKPVPGALAFARGPAKTSVGVRGDMIQAVGEDGSFAFHGIPLTKLSWYGFGMEGFLLDPRDGSILMAPDLGQMGAAKYPIDVAPDANQKTIRVVLFECNPMTLYDLVDQRQFALLGSVTVLEAVSNAQPFSFGLSLPEAFRQWQSYVEPVAVIYAARNSEQRLKLGFGASVLGNTYLLINASAENPMGIGYDLAENPSLFPLPEKIANDIWVLDDWRIHTLTGYGIKNQRMEQEHASAKTELELAQQSLEDMRYDAMFRHLRAALGFETRVYPEVVKTTRDVVKGVLFYLALLLPFAFFCERLFFASMGMGKQIMGSALFFVIVFAVLWVVHPAFQVTNAPLIVLLAFVMITLTFLVTWIIVSKFDERMRILRQQMTGLRETDMGRFAASSAAFSLGVANMRRRRTRSTLTCVTLILLTFTLMSFTSVVTSTRYNRVGMKDRGQYYGLLIRDRQWNPIALPALRFVRDEYAKRSGADTPNEPAAPGEERPAYAVAPRAWYLSEMVGNVSHVAVSLGGQRVDAKSLVGLTADEDRITGPSQALTAGRWFRNDETEPVCILPEHYAELLGTEPDDVGNVTVSIVGSTCRVIGVFDPALFQQVVDIDGEPLTPVDYAVMAQKQRDGNAKTTDEVLDEYVHYNAGEVVLVPYEFAMDAGATLRSISVLIGDPDQVEKEVDSLVKRVEFNMYVRGKESMLISVVGASGIQSGGGGVFIALMIAALIVLNTMLGAVYERTQEIGIFSSLGLAPVHIASLFVAESLVYAVLGAVVGYLIGQSVAKCVVAFGIFPELSLNYSSMAAVLATLVVMLTVLASTAYPARMAGRLATPGVDRRWRLVDPKEGIFEITLPFSSAPDQVLGLNAFLHEYLSAHVEYSTGKFSADNVDLECLGEITEEGVKYHLASTVWIAPYDLGVREHFTLVSGLSEEQEGAYGFWAIIKREDGDEGAWIRLTRNFLTVLRQEFLLWRTFDPETRAEYAVKGYHLLGKEPPSALVELANSAKQVPAAAESEGAREVGAE